MSEDEDIVACGEAMIRKSMFLNEMARVGYFDNDGLEVYVHTNDPGNIPHFHVRDSATQGEKFHSCIELQRPVYFHHTGKEDTLNSKQRKKLMEFFLSKPDEDSPFKSNWDAVVYEWNRNNSDCKVPKDISLPDYSAISDNK